jgi:Xaa-Pro aminopeptidase
MQLEHYAVGRVDEDKYRIYNVVKEAQEMAFDSIKASNAICNEIDKIARSYIDSKGYGSMFIHSTGHGIGLEVHEPPWISQRSEHILKDGMTVTIEPGIYLAGRFGVRIEDSVLIWNGDAEILNRYPKDLIVL